MAVFLALPSCPCQLFESLGVDFPHKHEVGTVGGGNADYNGITEWKGPSKGSDQELPVCHCEEGIGKTAEGCSGCEFDTPTQCTTPIHQDQGDDFITVFSTGTSARAPPLEMLSNYWLNSARTGVYRL